MSKAYITDSFRSIKRTMSRFISIVAIVALGSGLFCGLNAVGPDMLETANQYYDEYNLMDLRVQSYLGIYEGDLEQLRAIDGVKSVQGAKFVDGYVQTPNDDGDYEGIVDIDGSELTVRVIGFDLYQAVDFQNRKSVKNYDGSDYINRLKLIEGVYPQAPDECVVTCSGLTTPEQFVIGNTIKVVGDDEEISYYLKNSELKIVGIVETPYWISYERGVTTAGSGKLGDFVYVNNDAFTDRINYYSEAYITLEGTDEYEAYTEEYDKFVAEKAQVIMEQAEVIAEARRNQLVIGLPEKLAGAKVKIEQAEAEIGTKLDDAKAQLDELYELERDGERLLKEAQELLDTEYADAQSQLQNGSEQYMAAVNEYNEKYQLVSNSQTELSNKKAQYNAKRLEADNAKSQLDSAKSELNLANAEIKVLKGLIDNTKSTLETLRENQNVSQGDLHLDEMAERLDEVNPELADILRAASNLTGQGMAADAIVEVEQLLEEYEVELATAEDERQAGQEVYDAKKAEYDAADAQLNQAKAQLDKADADLVAAQKQLQEFKDQIESSGDQLQYGSIEAQTQYMTAQATLALRQTQYQNIKQIIAQAEKQYQEAVDEVNARIGIVKTEYKKGESLLESINNGAGWSVYDRYDSPGYEGYGQAAKNMVSLAYIFPTFFFIVSTLVCLTTMTRMVEEERTQLGILKALGYSNKMITGKYLIYALLASVIGIILGTAVCIYGIPFCITGAWGIMYELPNTVYKLMPVYIMLGALIAIGSTVLAAYIACRNELKVVPSVLMRPKPPKAGKRVFLENINFIWKRLSFTSKVTVRNLFRNFNRFAVTVLGIAGCTALILAAFGLRDAIGGVIDNQYAKDIGIAQYDLQVVLKDYQNSYNESLIVSDINNIDGIDSSMLVYLKVCEGFSDREDNTLEVDVLVPENPTVFQNFVNLEYKGKDVPLTDEGVVISKKFADKTDTKVGDTVKISWTEGSKVVEYDVLVTGITENYTFHYVYMTPYYFSKLTQSNMSFNYLFCKLTDGITPEQKVAIESRINEMRGVNGSVYTTVVIDNFNNIVNSLNIVIMLLIVAAMGLAIVVIYNLNNINVNERIRELATLKVLGFYDGEVSAYIYRENIFLTVIGIALGLVLGIPLNIAVIDVVDIDTLTFKTDLEPLSFILAIAITVVFAIIVNFLMHLKLKKISMVESLKSVE